MREAVPVAQQFDSVDAYIDSFPDDVRAALEEVRRTVRAAASGCEEAISYGIPTMRLDGRYVVYFAGWKNHISLYPVPSGDTDFEADIAAYRSGKGTLKLPLGEPIPHDLVTRVVTMLVQEHAARRR